MKPNGLKHEQGLPPRRDVLENVADHMKAAGYYAYLHLDDQNRLGVSVDTEDGHVDVRFEGAVFVVEAWDTSPGLFWEEDNQRRFHAMERRARIVLPAIARGITEPDQEIWWDETDHGVGARVRTFVSYDEIERIPALVRDQFDELNRLLASAERGLLD